MFFVRCHEYEIEISNVRNQNNRIVGNCHQIVDHDENTSIVRIFFGISAIEKAKEADSRLGPVIIFETSSPFKGETVPEISCPAIEGICF